MDEATMEPKTMPPDNPVQLKRILEAVLLSATQPLTLYELKKVFADEIGGDVLRVLLEELRGEWAERPLELVQVASGWRFRTRAEFLPYLERLNPEKAGQVFTRRDGNAGHYRLPSTCDPRRHRGNSRCDRGDAGGEDA